MHRSDLGTVLLGTARPEARRLSGPAPLSFRQELAVRAWQALGACRSTGESVFFAPDVPKEPRAERLRRLVAAKRVCANCPVREACRSYALEREEEFGVWGGLSEIERKQLIAERRGAQAPHAWRDAGACLPG